MKFCIHDSGADGRRETHTSLHEGGVGEGGGADANYLMFERVLVYQVSNQQFCLGRDVEIQHFKQACSVACDVYT